MVHTFVTGVTKMRRTAVILMGLTLYANAAAAITTTSYGAVAPIPVPAVVRQLLSGE